MTSRLTKQVESKMEGEFKTTKTHIIKLELERKISDIIYDIHNQVEDCESLFHSYGMSINFDDEIMCIDLDKLSEQLEYEIKNPDEDSDPKKYYKDLLEFLNKYKGYTLWF